MDTGRQEGASEQPRPSPLGPARANALTVAATGLFVLAVFYTLYFAREILMPLTAAVLLSLVLHPPVRILGRLKVPEPIGAALVTLALSAVLTAGIYFLVEPATKWASRMPQFAERIQEKIEEPIEDIQKAKEEVEKIVKDAAERKGTGDNAGENAARPNVPEAARIPVPEEARSASETADSPAAEQAPEETMQVTLAEVFITTLTVLRDVGWSVVVIFVLMFFLLATGSMFREKVILSLPTFKDKKRTLIVARDVQKSVSAYLATVTLINIALGVAMGFAMYLIGLPNAAVWGAMAMMLNFVPYLGPFVGMIIVGIVGLLTFDAPIQAVLPPLVYAAINMLEGNLITPLILSQRLTMNPVAVFVSVILWAWLWGVPGALMAVPLLACFKVVCDKFDRLQPISQFLGGRTVHH